MLELVHFSNAPEHEECIHTKSLSQAFGCHKSRFASTEGDNSAKFLNPSFEALLFVSTLLILSAPVRSSLGTRIYVLTRAFLRPANFYIPTHGVWRRCKPRILPSPNFAKLIFMSIILAYALFEHRIIGQDSIRNFHIILLRNSGARYRRNGACARRYWLGDRWNYWMDKYISKYKSYLRVVCFFASEPKILSIEKFCLPKICPDVKHFFTVKLAVC